MIADRQHARGGHDAEKSGLLEIDAAVRGMEVAPEIDAGLDLAGSFRQELGETGIAGSRIEGAAP